MFAFVVAAFICTNSHPKSAAACFAISLLVRCDHGRSKQPNFGVQCKSARRTDLCRFGLFEFFGDRTRPDVDRPPLPRRRQRESGKPPSALHPAASCFFVGRPWSTRFLYGIFVSGGGPSSVPAGWCASGTTRGGRGPISPRRPASGVPGGLGTSTRRTPPAAAGTVATAEPPAPAPPFLPLPSRPCPPAERLAPPFTLPESTADAPAMSSCAASTRRVTCASSGTSILCCATARPAARLRSPESRPAKGEGRTRTRGMPALARTAPTVGCCDRPLRRPLPAAGQGPVRSCSCGGYCCRRRHAPRGRSFRIGPAAE